MNKISVIVPIYNVEQDLGRCIERLVEQTMKDIEIILIDDGSTDMSGYICDNYAKKDKRIKVVHTHNQGVSAARNIGIKESNGEFIAFVDPDDYIDLDALDYLYKLAQKYTADIICYRMKTYKENKLTSIINEVERIEIYNAEKIIEEYVRSGKFLYTSCNKLYLRKLILENNLRFNEHITYAEDALFNYYVLNKANKLVSSNVQKYNYFIHKNSTVSFVTERRLDVLKAQTEIYKLLKKNYPQGASKIIKDYMQSSIQIVIDIAREKSIISKYKILQNLKDNILKNTEIVEKIKDVKKIGYRKRLFFEIIKVCPLGIALLYRMRFLIVDWRGRDI